MPNIASKSTTPGRPGYSLSFRHPLRTNSKGKTGLKVRRGLGTTEESEADALVGQMNELLADESWWAIGKQPEALRIFDARVVDAFYDGLRSNTNDSYGVRESIMPLPGRTEGYSRALLVGTTGAGKTSVLRHLIGSDPDEDRFPSTSAAKTTISDIEIIPAEGIFEAVVTFFPEVVIRANLEDCVVNAVTAAWDGQSEAKVMDQFLNHPDQRFRLGYVLGRWIKGPLADGKEDDWDFGDTRSTPVGFDDEATTASETQRNQQVLQHYLDLIVELAAATKEKVLGVLEFSLSDCSIEDREAATEIMVGDLYDSEDFHQLVEDVLEDIAQRFRLLEAGTLSRGRGRLEWPATWTFEAEDRQEFLREVRWFSSNYASSFGKLLTPLVDGIRVRGPMFPSFTTRRSKVVLFDGQGLGHTPDSFSSLTTHITKRFADVDVILLVDNAEQPIQAAAQSVLRAVASSGNYAKLAIGFTHFDHVNGLNLPSFFDKRKHVLASVHNYLVKLKEILNPPSVASLERVVDEQSFMLGGMQGKSKNLPKGVRLQLEGLLDFCEAATLPATPVDASPRYDASGLNFAVQRATSSFQDYWAARLGLATSSTVGPEHHTRVKALNRRISNQIDVEYDNLRPVADLVGRISEEASNFLDNPVSWSRSLKSEGEGQEAIAPIRREVFTRLHQLAGDRLTAAPLAEWRQSLTLRGKGSAARRAQAIRSIYALAAPVPGTVNSETTLALMREVKAVVAAAVVLYGGSID